MLSAVKGDRLVALYSVALALGLRQGEALGLRWQDVDLDRGRIKVVHQLQRVNGKLELVDLKTDLRRRTLVLPTSTWQKLSQHHARQSSEKATARHWENQDLVFTNPEGRPLEGTTVSRMFHRHLDAAGIPQRRFHDLRHSCATLLLVQGVSPRVVMEVLGHSEVRMTLNTYSQRDPAAAPGGGRPHERDPGAGPLRPQPSSPGQHCYTIATTLLHGQTIVAARGRRSGPIRIQIVVRPAGIEPAALRSGAARSVR